jgi:hypothetical protein
VALRPAPSGDEIARILRESTPAQDVPIVWAQAAKAVCAAYGTNNSTARRWLKEATQAKDPAVLWVSIGEGGLLQRIMRPNKPGFPWYDPTIGDEFPVVGVEPEAYGLPEYSNQLRIGPGGELWVSERRPPTKGLAAALGVNSISCAVLATTLATLVERNAAMRVQWALGNTAAGAALGPLRELLVAAGIRESYSGQKLLLVPSEDDEDGPHPAVVVLRLSGVDIDHLNRALQGLGLRSP